MCTINYAGMTVNERLFAAGLVDEFDKAVHVGDIKEACQILMQVELTAKQARETIETILKQPEKYGFQVRPGVEA